MRSEKTLLLRLLSQKNLFLWRLLVGSLVFTAALGCGNSKSDSNSLMATPDASLSGEEIFKKRLDNFVTQIHPDHKAKEIVTRFHQGEWGPDFAAGSRLHLINTSEAAVKSDQLVLHPADKIHDVNASDNAVSIPAGATLKNSDEEISRWDTKVSFGLEGKVFSVVSVAAKQTVTYAVATSKQLLLVKERKDSDTQMLSNELVDQTDSHGQPMLGPNGLPLKKAKLVTDDGLKFVFQCAYTSRSENSVRNEGSVSFNMGVAVSVAGGHESGNISNITATSAWYNVESSDTLFGLLDFCQDAFAQKTKNQVKREIENYMAGAAYNEAAASRQRSLLISAALYGDKASRIEIDGHHWNALPASIDSSEPGVVKVSGRLEHSLAAQRDDVMHYHCVTRLQELSTFDVDIKQHSATTGWRDVGRALIKDICHDAFVEFAKDVD